MKLIVFASFLVCSNVWSAVPKIEFRYARVFDMWCSSQNQIEITDDQRIQLSSKLNDIQNEWDLLGPILLKKTEELLGKNFKQKEMIASIFLCKKTPSMSLPLLINGNWFAYGDQSVPNYMITALTFHELIHTFLVDNYPELLNSPLIKKYQSLGESGGVLAHLHLNAIQKMVYLSLGMKDRLQEVKQLEVSFSKYTYKRAWEIVEQEGHQSFIDELKY